MHPNTKLWGSQNLTGAASLRYRMPVCGGCSKRIAQSVEHQTRNLRVAGSIPATSTNGLGTTANHHLAN
jgi:hypothetical protein